MLLSKILQIYNLSVKQFESRMKPHVVWVLIQNQRACKGYQQSAKFADTWNFATKLEGTYNNKPRLDL